MKPNEIFAHYIKAEGVAFKHARGLSDKSGKEFHVYHEIILFLGGEAELISENVHLALAPNTLIVIPRETYHQMRIKGDQQSYYRCILNFEDLPELSPLMGEAMRELVTITADEKIAYLFATLIKHANTDNESSKIILRSALALLLGEIEAGKSAQTSEIVQNELVRRAVSYIGSHLGSRITAKDVAGYCNVAASTLTHIFRREMNISLHQYIVKKRLILAYRRIHAGEPATLVAGECGFGDYSGFYKQYKKMFGTAPSVKK